MEQMTINLRRYDGCYHNFFAYRLSELEKEGWYILDMDLDKKSQKGWVILQRKEKKNASK